ncbi:RNA-binding domain-containing protein [Mucor lusitanicus]
MSRSPERMNIDDDVRVKGRGFSNNDGSSRRAGRGDAMDEELEPVRSVEGWIVIVRGLHEEADEESLGERFMEYGTIKNIHLNLDRRTGYVKGYAFIEYEARKEAETAITEANDTQYLGETIKVDYAFIKGPAATLDDDRDRRDRRRDRSLSPARA